MKLSKADFIGATWTPPATNAGRVLSNGTVTVIPVDKELAATTVVVVDTFEANLAVCAELSRFHKATPDNVPISIDAIDATQAGGHGGPSLTGFDVYVRMPPLRGRPGSGIVNLNLNRV